MDKERKILRGKGRKVIGYIVSSITFNRTFMPETFLSIRQESGR